MEIVDTLEFLLGTWKVDRHFQDFRLGVEGHFRGAASISDQELAKDGSRTSRASRALLDESGELRFGNYAGQARRHLEFQRLDASAVSVNFADGRHFVDLDLRKGNWRSEHLCGSDNYEIVTLVLSADSFEERWHVRGTAKRYVAVTNFARI